MSEYIPSPALRARFERSVGQPIARFERLEGRGYTPALRLRAWLRDGGTVFIKCGVTELTAGWIVSEAAVYTRLQAPFIARLLAWEDGPARADEYPFLVLEDLSAAFWPPPWTPQRIERVRAMLAVVAATRLPGLPALEEETEIYDGWQRVAADPAPFLSLGLAGPDWLERALPALLALDCRAALRGEALVHCDVRSDNICLRGEQAMLIDWNLPLHGSPLADLAFWLPSLQLEGGPPPESILPDAPAFAAIISGYMAARAGLPIIPDAPRVRAIQYAQLRCALPWAVRALQLPPPSTYIHVD